MSAAFVESARVIWQPLWDWGAALSVQLAVVVGVVAVLDGLLGRRVRPQLIAMLWLLVLVKLVVPPTWSSPVSLAALAELVPWTEATTDSIDGVTLESSRRSGASSVALPDSWRVSLVAVWLVGVVLLAALAYRRYRCGCRTLLGVARSAPAWLERLGDESRARLGLRGARPRLLVHPGVPSATLVGYRDPVVVLPLALLSRREPLEHVLLHEFTHYQRRDPWWALVAVIAQIVYWFHPLVYAARARLVTLREVSCDHAVAQRLGGRQIAYRRTLLELAGVRRGIEPAAAGLAFLRRPRQIVTRLRWLERPAVEPTWRQRSGGAVVALVVLFCCLPLASRPPESVTVESGAAAGGGGAAGAGTLEILVDTIDGQRAAGVRVGEEPHRNVDPPTSVAMRGDPLRAIARSHGLDLNSSDDLVGCLPRRYLVLGMLAQESSESDPRAGDPHTQGSQTGAPIEGDGL